MAHHQPNRQEAAGEAGHLVDWNEVLDSVQGRKRLLVELIEIFLVECPRLLHQIDEAIAAGDGKSLQVHAHGLKGCLRYFGDNPAGSAALALELLGRGGHLENAPSARVGLNDAIQQMLPELRRFLDENRADCAQ